MKTTNLKGYYTHLLSRVCDKVKAMMDITIASDNLNPDTAIFNIQYSGKWVLVWKD